MVIIVMAVGARVSRFRGLRNALKEFSLEHSVLSTFYDRKSDPVGLTQMHSDAMTTRPTPTLDSISGLTMARTYF